MISTVFLAMSGICNYKCQIAVSRTVIKPKGEMQEVYVASWSGFKHVVKTKAMDERHRNFSERA